MIIFSAPLHHTILPSCAKSSIPGPQFRRKCELFRPHTNLSLSNHAAIRYLQMPGAHKSLLPPLAVGSVIFISLYVYLGWNNLILKWCGVARYITQNPSSRTCLPYLLRERYSFLLFSLLLSFHFYLWDRFFYWLDLFRIILLFLINLSSFFWKKLSDFCVPAYNRWLFELGWND